MDEQWQAPWQYGWEQPPPPPTPWEPPVTPLPPPHTRRRKVTWVATALGGAALLGALLATCGPSGEEAGAPVGDASASPSPSEPVVPVSPRPSPSPTPAAPAALATVSESPAPTPTPRQATPGSVQSSHTPRPLPAKSPRTEPAAAPPRPGTTAPSLRVCAEAERLGEWAPGSDQAKLCRSLYGE